VSQLPITRPVPDVQEPFFERIRAGKILIEVTLVDGATRLGRLARFDRFSFILDVGGREELIYKHAVATVRAENTGAASPPA
jgi:host factor-I protein